MSQMPRPHIAPDIATHYIIAAPSVDSNLVFDVTNDLYWLWLDEQWETEQEPYMLTLKGTSSDTMIWYFEEHRTVFEARYFIVQGQDSARSLAQIRERFPLLDAAALAEQFRSAADPLERGSAIYQLGVASTGQPFDPAIQALLAQGLADTAPGVRLSAIWACAWAQWPELRPLLAPALADTDQAVRDTATALWQFEGQGIPMTADRELRFVPDSTLSAIEIFRAFHALSWVLKEEQAATDTSPFQQHWSLRDDNGQRLACVYVEDQPGQLRYCALRGSHHAALERAVALLAEEMPLVLLEEGQPVPPDPLFEHDAQRPQRPRDRYFTLLVQPLERAHTRKSFMNAFHIARVRRPYRGNADDNLILSEPTRKPFINAFQGVDDWIIYDEKACTAAQPYTVSFSTEDLLNIADYIQDDLVDWVYVLVYGPAAEQAVQYVAEILPENYLAAPIDVAALWAAARTPDEQIAALYRLAVGTSSDFDAQVYAIVAQAAADASPILRRAAIRALRYLLPWPQARALLAERAASDELERLRHAAQALLDEYDQQDAAPPPIALPGWYAELQQDPELRARGVIFLDLAAQQEREGGYLPCIAFSDTEIASDNLYTLRLLFRPSAPEQLYIAFLGDSEWLVPLAPSSAATLAFIDKYVAPTEDIPQQQWGAGVLAEVVRLRDENTRPLRLAAPGARYLRYYIGMVDEDQGEDLFMQMENSLTFNHFLARRKVCMSAYDQTSATYETQAFSQYSGSLFSYQMQMAYGQAIFFLAINYQPYDDAEQIRSWRAERGGLLEQLPDDLPLDLAGAIASNSLARLIDQAGMAELARAGDFNALLTLDLLTPSDAFDSVFLPLLPHLDAECRAALAKIAAARAPASATLAALRAEE